MPSLRKFDCIAYQIGDRLAQAAGVGDDKLWNRTGTIEVHRDIFLARAYGEHFHHFAHDLVGAQGLFSISR
jgi:hypothetical protein